MKYFFVVMLGILVACTGLKFEKDASFLSAAQANMPEYLVAINGYPCRDMDGEIGACLKKIKSNGTLEISIAPRPYDYRLELDCSDAVNSDISIDILKNDSYKVKIKPDQFKSVRNFTCIGEIFPGDRAQTVSSMFHIRVIVYDKRYLAREEIYHKKKRLVLGRHARHSFVDGKFYSKKTTLKMKKAPKLAWSESEIMRINYYGY